MKLWRKIKLEDGSTSLEEVSDVSQINTDKPVLLVFPPMGANTGSKRAGRVISGNIKHMTRLLGATEADPEVEILAVSYDKITMGTKIPRMNRRLDKFHNPEAKQFVDQFLAPLQEQGVSPTLYGYSLGSVFAENVRKELIDHYRIEGHSDKGIRARLEDICLLTGGNASNAINPDAKNRNHSLDFTTVVSGFSNDVPARLLNPSFKKSIPPGHNGKNVSVTHLTGNRIQLLVDAPKRIDALIPSEKEGVKRRIITGKRPTSLYLRVNHSSELAVYRGAAEEELLVGYYERVLRNAVKRKGKVQVENLLKPAPAISRAPKMYHASQRPSEEDRKVAAAVANCGTWQGRVSATPANGGHAR